MSPKRFSKYKSGDCNMLAHFMKMFVFIITISLVFPIAGIAQQKSKDPVLDDRMQQMKDMLTRLLENDQEREERLSAVMSELAALKTALKPEQVLQSDITKINGEISTLSENFKADLAAAEKEIDLLKAEIEDLQSANEALKEAGARNEFAVSELLDDVKLNTDYRNYIEKIERYTVLEDDEGIAQLIEPKELANLSVNLPTGNDCSEVGTWFINDYIMRSRNSFYVGEASEAKICDYENGNWIVRAVQFNDRSHIIDVGN